MKAAIQRLAPTPGGAMPQFMLLIYPPAEATPPGDPGTRLAGWQDYERSLEEAGVVLSHGRLNHTDSATAVRVRDGETLISDGPFAETKEFLAGFYLVDCPDLDTALGHAARMPAAGYGTVEVRPMMYPAGTSAAAMEVSAPA
jgi:hypothetical protein